MTRYLVRDDIVTHPYVVGELALGSFADRTGVLEALDKLPHLNVAETEEVRELIERRNLYSKGIGWVDVHLIASTLIHPSTQLWTTDKRLARTAAEIGIPLHPVNLPN